MDLSCHANKSLGTHKNGRVIGHHGGGSPFGDTEDNIAADFFSGLDDPVGGGSRNGLRSEIPVIAPVFRIALTDIPLMESSGKTTRSGCSDLSESILST